MFAPLHDVVVVSSILLSATTYLFDFGSNVVVLLEYSKRFLTLSRREAAGPQSCGATCRHQTSELAGYFYGLLGILVCCHSLNAILFKIKFKHRDAPLWAAYFLPLIHLYRLSNLLWRTLSSVGVQDLRSPEMNGLYCIMGSAMEGVPMLILQFCGYLVLTREGIFLDSMIHTFKVSAAASLISAAYNGGTSVQSIAKNAITFKQKLWAGAIGAGYTLCAALARCLTFANIIVHIREYFSQQRTVREQARFHVSDSLPLLVIGGSIVSYSLHFWLFHSPKDMVKNVRNLPRLLGALSFSFMSMILGPLYPMISIASDGGHLGCGVFRGKLLAISILHVLLDVVVVCVTRMLGTLPTPSLIVSAIAIAGYLGFLIAYARFDASCGPQRALEHADDGHIKAEAEDVKLDEMRNGTGSPSASPCDEEEAHIEDNDAERLFLRPTCGEVDAVDAEKSRLRLIRCFSLDRGLTNGAKEAGPRLWPFGRSYSFLGLRR